MNLEFSKKHIIITVFCLLLLGSLSFGAYYLYIIPTNNLLEQKKSELKLTNQELSIINNKLKQTSDQTLVSTMELQKQVPVKRLLDQMLLEIEKAEIISGTNIIETKLDGTEKDEDVDLTKSNSNSTDSTDKTENEVQQQSPSQKEKTLPNGIKETSIILSGEADTYFDMEKFLTQLESLNRIVKIDKFKFTGRKEIYSVEESIDPINFEVTISVYYYPKLVDLQKDLPPLDTPKISNKKNPISEISDMEGNDEENENKQP